MKVTLIIFIIFSMILTNQIHYHYHYNNQKNHASSKLKKHLHEAAGYCVSDCVNEKNNYQEFKACFTNCWDRRNEDW